MGTDIVIPMCHNLTSDLNLLDVVKCTLGGLEKKSISIELSIHTFFKKSVYVQDTQNIVIIMLVDIRHSQYACDIYIHTHTIYV